MDPRIVEIARAVATEGGRAVVVGGYVREAMCFLGSEEQRLLDLRFVQGQPLAEIAGRPAISLEQTKYRLRRATVSLRKVLLNQFAVEEARE